MRHHTHQVPSNKSADTILDEFLLGQQQQHKNFLKRLPQQDTTTNLKVPSSPGNTKPFASPTATTQRNQNLLFSISGGGRGSGRDHESTFQHASGMTSSSLEAATSQIVQIQRKLIGFFFIYATIILTLYLTYAVYSYYQQSQFRLRQQQQFVVAETATIATSNTGGITPASSLVSANNLLDEQQQSSDQEVSSGSLISKQMQEFQTKLEDKIHLLERYIEVLALDLEDTKGRLKEREKCACSIGCSFNGTRYSDGQRWQSKCDTCTCQSGKISCLPRECPKLTCDDPVQLPGRCCPTCMKKCKINNTLVRHGHSFRPSQLNGEPAGKQCKCHDGLIKCEPIKPELDSSNGSKSLKVQQQSKFPAAGAKNRTLEYLKSILVTRSAQMQLDSTVGHQQPLRNNSSSSSSEAGGTSGL